jgi:hypothetical protein
MNRQPLRQFTVGVLVLTLVFGSLPVSAEEDVREGTCAGAGELFPDSNPGPGTLKALRPKHIPELATYVRDRRAAIALGKALFWDMRNIELTAPYFHNGGQATLLQVVNFYNRGGDFREHNAQFIDFEIGALHLTPQELDDLVAFLKGLTDQRVLYRKAPFDGPQLFVPNGHRVRNGVPAVDSDGTAADVFMEIPAVGRNGGAPLKAFLKQ